MPIFLSFFRVTKFAFQNFLRNFWLAFITISVFILTLLTVNAVLFMNLLADAALKSVEQKIQVSVYFKPETSEDMVKSVQGYLLGLPQVREVEFVSAVDALASFKTRHANDPIILASLDEIQGNPFGHALNISAHSAEDFPFILEVLNTPEYEPQIEKKDFNDDYQKVVERITTLSTRVRYGGIALALFFGLIAILMIFNAVRIAIYVHRDEIGIMKLVGANDWFVRGPFILEAILYSLLATAIVAVATIFAIDALEPWIVSYFGDLDSSVAGFFKDNALMIFGGEFLTLSILSILTTLFAMRRYLRV